MVKTLYIKSYDTCIRNKEWLKISEADINLKKLKTVS